MQIWKWALGPSRDVQVVMMPVGAQVLTAREQGGAVCVWALCDAKAPKSERLFEVVGTGWEMPERTRRYIGTAQFLDGMPLVFHVFEVLQ